ncbi:MAG: hypothetical protein HYS15_01100 [Candidatus Spechtbacteria bacterium]|nr:hypothetical protein [Candidatus Spechtbacteria bacterium]
MNKTSAVLFSLLLTPFIFAGAFFYAHAHAGEEHSASYNLAATHLAKDATVDPSSLGVGTPDILPGHPFYFTKSLSRGFRSTFTFGAEKKAELKLTFASEKIAEAQLLLERGQKDRALEHLKSYEKDLSRARDKGDAEKFIHQTFKHQAVLDKIEKEVGEEKAGIVKEIREKTIEHVAEVVAGIEDDEIAKNALIAATSDEGSAFKPLRNLEVLKAVEEKVPDQAKDAIRAAQENAVKRFKSEYDKGTVEEKDALSEYIKGAGGDASRYIEAFNENKEILGEELSHIVLAAGEEKKAAEAAKSSPSSPLPSVASECYPPVSPKPSLEAQSEVGTMTIAPEVSQASKDNTIVVSVVSHIDSLTVQLRSDQLSPLRWKTFRGVNIVDWGPKEAELPTGGKGVSITMGDEFIKWETHDYVGDNGRMQKRPLLPAQKYWVKLKAQEQTTEWDSDKNIGSYGWKEVTYDIHYFVGPDISSKGDFITKSGKSVYYVGGPQIPVGKIVRVGDNIEPHYGKFVTVKAGEPFEIEAKPTGWQGGVMTIVKKKTATANSNFLNARIIGQDAITVKAGESAIWKVLPTGTSPVQGIIQIKNNCNDLDVFFNDLGVYRGNLDNSVGTFEAPIKYDFKNVTKEKMQLALRGAVTYALDFQNPQSSFTITPSLELMDGTSFVAPAPNFTLKLTAVYKDNPQEIAKSIIITPEGKSEQAGSAQETTSKEGTAHFKIHASNVTKDEVTRGILLKATAPSIAGLKNEVKISFTNVAIEITKPVPTPLPTVEIEKEVIKPVPTIEKKEEPKKEEPKPYEGSPPLLY